MVGFIFLWAQPHSVQAAAPSFSAQMVQTTDGGTDEKSYFDLTLAPNQKQEVQIMIQNLLNKKNKIKVSPTVAQTSDSGHAVYNQTKLRQDETLTHEFPKLTGKAQTITVPPKGNQTVSFEIQAPPEAFEGLIMGGFAVQSLTAGSVRSADSDAADKHVHIGYAISVLLRSTATADVAVQPNLTVGRPKLVTFDNQPELTMQVQNTKANFVTDMTVTTKIYQGNNEVPLITDKQKGLSMAANSNFDFTIPWKTKSVIADKYHMVLQFKAGKQHWESSQYFLISQKQASYFNRQNKKIQPNYKPWIIMTVILLVVLIGAFSWILYYKGQQKGKNRNQRRKRR